MFVKLLYLMTFVFGLGLAVYSMLQGVERSRPGGLHRPSAILNAPTASAFAVVLGALGYLLVTRTTMGAPAVLVIGLISAGAAWVGMSTLMARWALANHIESTAEEKIQGQLALVIRAITASSPGEIVFHENGEKRILLAESLQGSEILADTEVVIDTVKDGIAHVEPWSVVEQRL